MCLGPRTWASHSKRTKRESEKDGEAEPGLKLCVYYYRYVYIFIQGGVGFSYKLVLWNVHFWRYRLALKSSFFSLLRPVDNTILSLWNTEIESIKKLKVVSRMIDIIFLLLHNKTSNDRSCSETKFRERFLTENMSIRYGLPYIKLNKLKRIHIM